MKDNLDQHFLINKDILDIIVKEGNLKKEDIVLEIGFGKGNLTRELDKKARVIAIEKDEDLRLNLENTKVIYGNILELIDDLKFNKIISNIPYSISEPLFKKLLKINFKVCILLIGENFYKILKEDNKIGLISKIFFNIEKVIEVDRSSFKPRPRVNSILIKITRKDNLNEFEKIIKEFILQSDKKVKNALIYSLVRVKKLKKKEAKDYVIKNIPLNLHEKNVDYLSNEQFKLIYDKLRLF